MRVNTLETLSDYVDEQGNRIESPTAHGRNISVTFSGKNNKIIVHPQANIGRLKVTFDGDNGTLRIGHHADTGWLQANIRIGEDSTVEFGNNVSTTAICVISAVEGTTVTFGNDVMIASGNQFRADDSHPIFDVKTGVRVNPSKDIIIGNHVWFAFESCALGGAVVGDGSVIGFRSVVTGEIPSNAVAVGAPAKVVRRSIAWERPHLSLTEPPYKTDATTVEKSPFWNFSPPVIVDTSPSRKLPLVERAFLKLGYQKITPTK